MLRKVLMAVVAGASLLTFGVTGVFAQTAPQLKPVPGRPAPTLRPQGLLITQVLPGSPAAQQGLEPGDVIVGVNGVSVRGIADLNLLLARSPWAAQLNVIDGRTGWSNVVLVYPVNGRIGIIGEPAPLNPTPWPYNPGFGAQPTGLGLGR